MIGFWKLKFKFLVQCHCNIINVNPLLKREKMNSHNRILNNIFIVEWHNITKYCWIQLNFFKWSIENKLFFF